MIKNYIKIAFRNLLRNRSYTAINIFGLALGLATCLLIVGYVIDELSYDRLNKNIDRIFRIDTEVKFGGRVSTYAAVPAPVAEAVKSHFPEVEKVTRFFAQSGNFWVKKGVENIKVTKIVYADAGLFDIFTLPMVEGIPATALSEPNTVVITENTARNLFNRTDVVGETLVFNDTTNYKITGILKNIPRQSHFDFDYFLSMSSLGESKTTSWNGGGYNTYILVKNATDIKKLEVQLNKMKEQYVEAEDNYSRFSLFPVADIHLRSNRLQELGRNSSIEYVYIFSAVALFILLIACVNFMNLSTARSAGRAREVGVRKVLGSARRQLIIQFMVESTAVTFISVIIAILLAWALLPTFNQMSDKALSFNLDTFMWLLPSALALTLVIGLLAGSYPAFYLSSFNPVKVLKGKFSVGFRGTHLRSFLIVVQFTISLFLAISTLVIYNQLNYIQTKNLGYERDQVVIIKNVSVLNNQAQVFKQQVKKLASVQNATLTGFLPTEDERLITALFPSLPPDPKEVVLTEFWSVDDEYIKTLNMQVLKGRDFSKDLATDSGSIIINEAAARLFNFPDPLNQSLYRWSGKLMEYRIVGVIRDFNFNSLRENVTPVAMILSEHRGALAVRVNSTNLPGLLSQMENLWRSFSPNQSFQYSFMDSDFDASYRAEQRIGEIFISFTMLAIAIACLGLFGLSAYAAEQRTKEIGIRKILGASVVTILNMLSKDFVKLVIISIVIASPAAWLFMQKWLQNFAYRVDIHWWIFVLAGLASLLITFITISIESIKTAMGNPVKNLNSE